VSYGITRHLYYHERHLLRSARRDNIRKRVLAAGWRLWKLEICAAMFLATLTACHTPIEPKALTLAEALDSFDWAHHTEADFWAAYPELWPQYNLQLAQVVL